MNIHTVLKELAAVAFDARVDHPVLVIESDDWGMTGVPSRQVYENLVSAGVFPAGNPWYRDALETPEDLDRLYNVLSSVRDSRGTPAQLTANFIMSNPDPGRLLSGEEPHACFDTLPESCEENPDMRELKGKWEEGIKRGVFRPEYHGLYHLNVWRLAEALRDADPRLLEMLRHGARPAAMTAGTDRRLLSEHWGFPSARNGLEGRKRELLLVQKGARAFQRLFGRPPSAAVASHCLWNRDTEWAWSKCGIRYVQSAHRMPAARRMGALIRPQAFCMGAAGGYGLTYLGRNCRFEPSVFPEDTASRAVRQIIMAFETQRPAVVSMHRINFSGTVNPKLRDRSLVGLKSVLNTVVEQYPDVRFSNTAELGRTLRSCVSRDRPTEKIKYLCRRVALSVRKQRST